MLALGFTYPDTALYEFWNNGSFVRELGVAIWISVMWRWVIAFIYQYFIKARSFTSETFTQVKGTRNIPAQQQKPVPQLESNSN